MFTREFFSAGWFTPNYFPPALSLSGTVRKRRSRGRTKTQIWTEEQQRLPEPLSPPVYIDEGPSPSVLAAQLAELKGKITVTVLAQRKERLRIEAEDEEDVLLLS